MSNRLLMLIAAVFCAFSAARGREPEPSPAELRKALAGQDAGARCRALRLIGDWRHPADPTLLPSLLDLYIKRPQIRPMIACAIHYSGGSETFFTVSNIPDPAKKAAFVMGMPYGIRLSRETEDRAAKLLKELLEDRSPQVRAAAAETLGHFRQFDLLKKVLRDPDASVRGGALRGIAHAKSYGQHPDFTDDLQELANDPDPEVILLTAAAFAAPDRHTGKRVDEKIPTRGRMLAVLIKHQNPDLRRRALDALSEGGMVGQEQVLASVLDALKDTDSKVRLAAVRLLSRNPFLTMGGSKGAQAFAEMIADPDPEVRMVAVLQFRSDNDQRKISSALAPLCADPDGRIRMIAKYRTRQIKSNKEFVSLLPTIADDAERAAAYEVSIRASITDLGGLGDIGIADPSLKVRRVVLQLAAEFSNSMPRYVQTGWGRSREPMLTMIRDKDLETRIAAVDILRHFDQIQQLEACTAMFAEPEFHEAVERALGQLFVKSHRPR